MPERLHRGVAVAAVDAELAGVVLVAERHRLLARDARLRDIRGAVDERQPQSAGDDENTAPKILSREKVLVLRWKICAMNRLDSKKPFTQSQYKPSRIQLQKSCRTAYASPIHPAQP